MAAESSLAAADNARDEVTDRAFWDVRRVPRASELREQCRVRIAQLCLTTRTGAPS